MYSRLKTVPNTCPMSLGPATLVASDQLKPLMRDSRARRYLNPEAPMKTVLTALALLVSTLAPAHAGGVHATVEGPDRDGDTYTVRAVACSPELAMEPWGYAEGLVEGKHQSVLLRIQPTAEHGVYTFQRTWAKGGDWMLRVNLGAPPAPATVVTLSRDGAVKSSQLHWKSDGTSECGRALAKLAKRQGIKFDDGC